VPADIDAFEKYDECHIDVLIFERRREGRAFTTLSTAWLELEFACIAQWKIRHVRGRECL
jgi:hypothetical protein